MPTTVYELTSSSFTGGPTREDLLDVITLLSPTDTPFFTMFKKVKTQNVQTEWMVDLLDKAASNAVAEGSSATFNTVTVRQRLLNYHQISREDYDLSDTVRATRQAGVRDEMRFQMAKALKQWKRDVEYDIVNGSAGSGAGASTRCSRGIYYWLNGFSSRTATVTGSNTGNNLQEDDLNAMLQRIWVTGGLADYVCVTPTQKRHISSNFSGSANSRRTAPLTNNTLVNVVDIYESDFANIRVLPHRWFDASGVGGANLQRVSFALQHDKWMIGFLRAPKNVPLAKIGSSERAMVEGEWTLICMHPSANAFVSGHHSAATSATDFPNN